MPTPATCSSPKRPPPPGPLPRTFALLLPATVTLAACPDSSAAIALGARLTSTPGPPPPSPLPPLLPPPAPASPAAPATAPPSTRLPQSSVSRTRRSPRQPLGPHCSCCGPSNAIVVGGPARWMTTIKADRGKTFSELPGSHNSYLQFLPPALRPGVRVGQGTTKGVQCRPRPGARALTRQQLQRQRVLLQQGLPSRAGRVPNRQRDGAHAAAQRQTHAVHVAARVLRLALGGCKSCKRRSACHAVHVD